MCRGFSISSSGGVGGAPIESVPSGTPLSRYPQPGNPRSPSFHRNLTPREHLKLTATADLIMKAKAKIKSPVCKLKEVKHH